MSKPKVDQDICIGCGTCEAICPKAFRVNSDGKAEVIADGKEADQDSIQQAVDSCPVDAISLDEE